MSRMVYYCCIYNYNCDNNHTNVNVSLIQLKNLKIWPNWSVLICSKILRKSGLIMLQGSIALINHERIHTHKGLDGVDAKRGFLVVSQFNTCSILDRQIVHWIGLALEIYCSKIYFWGDSVPKMLSWRTRSMEENQI